ncbi:hypothetical protein FOMPIDRAFT_1059581 [Fomitopsis schrenkii]|uniref:Uncharacterized protein n=1 Tax=Fomitopsis schrenkii TaxID=2126942 RepID=S8FUG4_FOMSC|nr:hypothetical protein FOMPIDRAFT_1059581 [Fomitopsis schrenkii]
MFACPSECSVPSQAAAWMLTSDTDREPMLYRLHGAHEDVHQHFTAGRMIHRAARHSVNIAALKLLLAIPHAFRVLCLHPVPPPSDPCLKSAQQDALTYGRRPCASLFRTLSWVYECASRDAHPHSAEPPSSPAHPCAFAGIF